MKLRNAHKSIAAVTLAFVAMVGQSQATQAATLTTTSVSSTLPIGTTGTNATEIVVTATAVTGSPSNNFIVFLPTGWSFVSPSSGSECEAFITVTGYTMQMCQAINTGSAGFAPLISTAIIPAGTSVEVTFAANSLNVAAGRVFNLSFADTVTGGTTVDSGSATLIGGDDAGGGDTDPEPSASNALGETGVNGLSIAVAGLVVVSAGVAMAKFARRRLAS